METVDLSPTKVDATPLWRQIEFAKDRARHESMVLSDLLLLSVCESENDPAKIFEAVLTWRKARAALTDKAAKAPYKLWPDGSISTED